MGDLLDRQDTPTTEDLDLMPVCLLEPGSEVEKKNLLPKFQACFSKEYAAIAY